MDCLVTKLKGTVNDSTLLPLGGMYINIIQQEEVTAYGQRLVLNVSEAQTIKVENGEANLTTDSGMSSGWVSSYELTPNIDNTLYCKNGNYRILIPNKYSIRGIGRWGNTDSRAISYNIDDLKYSANSLRLFNGSNAKIYGNLDSLAGKELVCAYGLSNITGKISDVNNIKFKKESSLPCGIVLAASSAISGDLSELIHTEYSDNVTIFKAFNNVDASLSPSGSIDSLASVFPNLTSIDFHGSTLNKNRITGDIKNLTMPLTSMVIYHSNITGAIEDFVATQRLAGRTTGSCSNGGWWGNTITFKGSPISKATADTLSWTATQITCADETITA